MHIQFKCSGGIANLDLTFQIDTDKLPKEKNEKILNLIKAANLFNFKPDKIAEVIASGADTFSYHLKVADKKKNRSFLFTDITAPKEVRPLLDYLRKLAIEEKMAE
ncbi:protealysin inhibitor emfourin [Priestia megaterium]|uniref:protealysin inhibitor emfourin n=1 Tax=Priestia megaterium TaxID=1404 RepID=UPI00263BC000|nr:protealysin inhibitor emfourin [Priestia megaterium]MDN4862805.1 hypothetical protein [Priestia megaterium]